MKALLRTTAMLLCLALLSGCTSLFYYPTRYEHVDRTKMPFLPEDVFFKSEDGTQLHGWYFPARSAQRSRCTILYFHGNAQNLSTHFLNLYSAPSRGYDYFIFDYRGYGRSQGTPDPRGTVADGRSALRWLRTKFPDRPIVVFGQSLGGAVALRTVLDMKEEIPVHFLAVDSTFASYKSAARKALSNHWLTWLFQPLGWLLVTDVEAPEPDLGKLAPTPLLVTHGDADRTVDYSLGEHLFAKASEPKEFWRIPGGQHTDLMWNDHGKWAAKLYDTLDRACGTEKPPQKQSGGR